MGSTVGVIIPTYNRADLLKEALESVLAQTRVPEQVIVVDDGSTDHTWEMLRGYGPPVVAIRQPNRGRSAARNVGLACCTADFVCFLDSDDLLTPRSIEVRAGWLESHPDSGIICGVVEGVDLGGRRIVEPAGISLAVPNETFQRLARYNVLPITAFMLRRECLPSPPYFDETLHTLEDWDFILRVVAQCPHLHWLDEMVSLYRHHSGMTLPAGSRLSEDGIKVQDRVYEMAAFRALRPPQQARICCSHAAARMGGGFLKAARHSLVCSIRVAPWYVVAYPLWVLSWLGPSINAASARIFREVLYAVRAGSTRD